MAKFSKGPWLVHYHNPILVVDANGKEVLQALTVSNRKQREANARLAAAAWSYHVDGYELAMRVVDASLYTSDDNVNALVNRLMEINRQVEGRL